MTIRPLDPVGICQNAFTIIKDMSMLRASVAGLPANADLVTALKDFLKQQKSKMTSNFPFQLYMTRIFRVSMY